MNYPETSKALILALVLGTLIVLFAGAPRGRECYVDSSDLPVARYCPASYENYLPRERTAEEIDYVVIHTVQGSLESAVRTFSSPDLGYPRSAHYVVGRDGEVVKTVPPSQVAWHAGTDPPGSGGENLSRVLNENSIGIEHGGYVDGSGGFPTQRQYVASAALTRYLCEVYDIPVDREHIVGHDEIKSTKGDPGPRWDWNYYLDLVRNGIREPGVAEVGTRKEGLADTGGVGLPLVLLGAGLAFIGWGLVGG